MEDLIVTAIHHENCTPDKHTVHTMTAYHRLHFVLSGHGSFDGQKLMSGQAFLCRALERKAYMQSPGEPWSYYWINVAGDDADRLLAECGFGESGVIRFELTPMLTSLLGLGCESDDPEFLKGIFISVTALLRKADIDRHLRTPERHIRDAKALIDSCGGRITPSALAAKLFLSRAYLRNLFNTYEKLSVQEYIVRQRLTHACRFLMLTDYPIHVIAASVGYEDPFQFSRLFRRYYDMSPTAYRKRK